MDDIDRLRALRAAIAKVEREGDEVVFYDEIRFADVVWLVAYFGDLCRRAADASEGYGLIGGVYEELRAVGGDE